MDRGRHLLGEPRAQAGDDHLTVLQLGPRGGLALVADVAPRPSGDDLGHEPGVFVPPQQQVVGAIQRDEALGMASRLVDPRRVIDRHGLVDRRMEDEQRFAEFGDVALEVM